LEPSLDDHNATYNSASVAIISLRYIFWHTLAAWATRSARRLATITIR
jgi:hypothetical protein